jgi:tetratricopeptide (TPR) repeat protein
VIRLGTAWRRGGRFVIAAVVSATAALAGCGGAPEPPPPPDQEMESLYRVARFAYDRGQYQQAAILYDRVLARAYARDDLAAISEIGYESALARLREGRPGEAAAQARRVREELDRRGGEPFAELFLVEAVALYVSGEPAAADAAADAALSRAGNGTAVAARATYIKGMIAADRKDPAGLGGAIAALGTPVQPDLRADTLELVGRQRLLEGKPDAALPILIETADLRRETKDYSGMARALAFAGEAAESTGRAVEAADLFLRAGRSAAQQPDRRDAKAWLERAVALATRTDREDIADAAREQIAKLSD